ncbi:Protein of unknown function [Cupriavidus sp. YR651]|nr:DUF2474 family protein [Cupriavidus sp. YR651]SDD76758.1 Protein of unknown function [Cupriavidus sp. YR651]
MATQKRSGMGTRLTWLVALWVGGVGAVGLAAGLIRFAMHLAGMTP